MDMNNNIIVLAVVLILFLGGVLLAVRHRKKRKPAPVPEKPAVWQEDGPSEYSESREILQPANAQLEACEDDGETVALTEGCIVGISGAYQGAEIVLSVGEPVMIGRDSGRSNLVIEDKAVSRAHCQISYDAYNHQYILRDDSTNGVFLKDGSRVEPRQDVCLPPGTEIRLGNTEQVFLLR